jgi:integrase
MVMALITKRAVDAAKAGNADYFIFDDASGKPTGGIEVIKGFMLKVTPKGKKVYFYQYRLARAGAADKTPMRRVTLGKHGDLTPEQARERAKELAALVAQGIDPRQRDLDALASADAEKAAADIRARMEGELVFEKVAARWLVEYELDHRASSVGQAKVSINKYLVPNLRGKPMPHITKADLQAAFDKIPAKQRATRQQVFAYASILWRWALERGDIADNPVPSMAKPKAPKARDRVLGDDELVSIWRATEALREPLGAFYRVLMLTGQRREEVAGMTWAQLDRADAAWVIPVDKAKNKVQHIVPLAPLVVQELDRLSLARQVKAKEKKPDAQRWPKAGPVVSIRGKLPLSCFSQAKTALDAKVAKVRKEAGPIEPWRVHDLRRTLATGLQRLGVRFEVTEAVLNHVSGARAGVAGIYQRHDWKEEKRSALEAWARHVAAISSPADNGNVVSLSAAMVLK